MNHSFIFSFLIIFFSCFNLLNAQDILIDWGDEWQYYDAGNEPTEESDSTQWYDLDYDANLWESGLGQFGYGEGDENTVTKPANTQYFRKEFNVVDSNLYVDFDMSILFDDGANIYLNGQNLTKVNMPAGNFNYNTLAISTVENAVATGNFIQQLQMGINVFAIEVHQSTINSSDISFDLQLQANKEGYVEITRGPYLQKAAPNTVTIKWRTTKPTQSIVNYGVNINLLNQNETDLILKTDHEIQIDNLQANTKYYYEISNSDFVLTPKAEDMYFKTSPIAGQKQPVTAWILGDCGTQNNEQRAVRDAYYNYIGNNHTDMMLFLGDNAYYDGKDMEYQYALFENMYEDKLKNTIAWSTRGNHERYDASSQTIPYYDIFTFPTNGECGGLASGTEAYYSFDYANIHFIVLDSYDSSRDIGATMYTWCETDIQNTTAEWIVALWHHPPYTKGSHDSDREIELVQMRQNFLPMLEDNGIDLVLCGHSHSYERSYFLNGHYGPSYTFNINENTIGENGKGSGKLSANIPYEKYILGPEAGEGTVYITAGSSGKKTGGALNHQAMYYSVSQLGSCVLEVNEDTMSVKFLRETGIVEDYFTIIKGDCNYGGACDDGDPCTINDNLDADCECVGLFVDSDNDTVCDALDRCPNFNDLIDADNDGVCDTADQCPGFDDGIDVDNDGIPDGCDPCIAGTLCNDLNVCTVNDVLDNNCACVGVFLDTDNDTVCDANDKCPGFDDSIDIDNDNIIDGCDPCITNAVCSDDDLCTFGDKYDADCNCIGTYLDSDNDQVCNAEDCAPFNATLSNVDECGICGGVGKDVLNFSSSTLSHSGTGYGSVTKKFDAVYSNVSFTIFNINNQLTGSISDRYIEKVGVYYLNSDGVLILDRFVLNQSFSNINFDFPIRGITLRLYDDENNGTGSSTMQVSLSAVDGCFLNCIDELLIQNTIQENTYQAELKIISTGQVTNQKEVIFKAGESIELNTNFGVNKGAEFLADIETCQ